MQINTTNTWSMDTKTENKISFFDILIIILSVYVLVALTVSVFFQLPPETERLLDIIDNCICIFFIVDFVRNLYQAENKLNYMKWGWIDLISSIPTLEIFRVGRLFRLIRLLRILRAFKSTTILMKYVFKSKIKGTMQSATIVTLLLMIFSAISILLVEDVPGSNIKTADDALWWTFETITTVGYGDRYPVTLEGRIIGCILMIGGIGMFSLFTAYISSIFVKDNK